MVCFHLMEYSRLDILQKNFFCVPQKKNSYSFEITWGLANDDFFVCFFGWTTPPYVQCVVWLGAFCNIKFSLWRLFSRMPFKSLKKLKCRVFLLPLKVFLSLRCCCMLAHRLPALGNSCEIYSSFPLCCCFLFLFRWACPWPSGQAAFHSVFMQPVSTWDPLSWLLRALAPHNPATVNLSQLDQKAATRSWRSRSSQHGLLN